MVSHPDLDEISLLTPELMAEYKFDDLPSRQHNGAIAFATDLGTPVWYDEASQTWRAFGEGIAVIPADIIFQFLENSGSIEMKVDGSGTAVNFDYVVPTGKTFFWSRINLDLIGTKNVVVGFFSLAALTNGLLVQVLDTDDTVLNHFGTDDAPVKTHADWFTLAGIDVDSDTAANTSIGGIRWTIAKSGASMKLTAGQTIRVIVQDDLDVAALTQLRMMIQGVQRSA